MPRSANQKLRPMYLVKILLERERDNGFVYTAANLEFGKYEVLSHRLSPLSTKEVEKMARRMYQSKVAGAGRFETDRPYGQQISAAKCREILKPALPIK